MCIDHLHMSRCHLMGLNPYENPDTHIHDNCENRCLSNIRITADSNLDWLHRLCVNTYVVFRSVRTEEPMWGEDEDFSDHDYYNSIPGKEPPIGGVVDSRLRTSGALLGHIHTQPQSKAAAQVNLQNLFSCVAITSIMMHVGKLTVRCDQKCDQS